MNVLLHMHCQGDEFGILLRQKKKTQRSLPERQTERKNQCLRLPRHTGNPQLKYWKASTTTAWKTKSTRTPSLVFPYEKTGDFEVRAKSFALHCRSRGFFRGHVRSCEKGLWDEAGRVLFLSSYKNKTITNKKAPKKSSTNRDSKISGWIFFIGIGRHHGAMQRCRMPTAHYFLCSLRNVAVYLELQ